MMRARRFLKRLASDRRGAAALEFAFVGPLLFTLVLGTIEVGRMFYVRQGLEYATEQAARYYALNPNTASTAVTTYLQGQMPGGMGAGVTVGYTDTPACNSSLGVTCTMVAASYTFNFIAGFLGLGSKTLQARAQAVRWI